MIEVTITYQDKWIQSFSVTGHAAFAPEGKDIYCSGVSAVAQTALMGLIQHLSQPPLYQVEKGGLTCELSASLTQKDREIAQVILSTMESGLLAMQEAYHGYVKVLIRRS